MRSLLHEDRKAVRVEPFLEPLQDALGARTYHRGQAIRRTAEPRSASLDFLPSTTVWCREP